MTPKKRAQIALLASPVLIWGIVSDVFLLRISNNPVLFWSQDAIGYIILPSVTLVLLAKYCAVVPADYGLIRSNDKDRVLRVSDFVWAAVVFLSFGPIQLVLQLLIPPSDYVFDYKDVLPSGLTGKVLALYLAVTAGFVEEIFYRGILGLVISPPGSTSRSRVIYVLLSAALFGINHFGQGGFMILATAYLGAGAAILFLRSRILWPLVAGHIAVDILAN